MEAVDMWRCAPFEWGYNDCCTFAARCVDAMCDTEYFARLTAKYHDEASAAQYITSSGGLQAALTDWLGEPVERLALARRGDVVLFVDDAGQQAAGVCMGDRIAAVNRSGYSFSMGKAIAAWRVD